MNIMTNQQHFLDISDFSGDDLRLILEGAKQIKSTRNGVHRGQGPLAGKVLAMIFEQPSTRTRISFDVGMRELGGETLMLTGAEMQLGRGESIADTARVLSRFVDLIMIRMLDHDAVRELAEYATVPVINGLTKVSHPCQIMADIMTFEEHRGSIKGKTVSWVGDSNNVLYSWIDAASKFDFKINVAAPNELTVPLDWIEKAHTCGAELVVTDDPFAAVKNSDCVITDCWVSMGDDNAETRHNMLAPYQVNQRLMSEANESALFMHCLPAHRGEEVTNEVIDGPHSVVFDEAENRLHAQKGIMAWCMDALPER
ncbi:ornithine carbamoyltransferase [Pseudovibrio japonicus]|uniref:Ornithine carbamoyltransferase n=1 Tax=Pseudovibrio japonicus TaxID=366534 RepID=A0ABQ3E0J6_9HYPH|nr:ornithine carbamoyltransferase [Pseudovibrio japonicus]GHB20979.1 ornithine carbamoyltransferase [Pseudovibrio japonicus]